MTKRIIAMLLAILILFPSSALALSEIGTENFTDLSDAPTIYWVHDQDNFNTLFETNGTSTSVTQNISTPEASVLAGDAPVISSYTFDIDGAGGNAPITVTGELEEEYYGDYLVLTGIFEGTATINGVSCDVDAVIHKEIDGDKVSAGITIVPEDAQGLDDYIFFSMGQPIITVDMLPENLFKDKLETESQAAVPNNNKGRAASLDNYTFIDYDYASFSSSGYVANQVSHFLEFYKETNGNSLYATVRSYTDTVNDYFSDTGMADTTVKELQVHFQKVSGSNVHITNFELYDDETSNDTSFLNNSFISALVDLIAAIKDTTETSVYIIAFKYMWETLFENEGASVDTRKSGSYATVTHVFDKYEDVNFDDAEMPIEVNLFKEGTSATGTFYVRSSIKYYTTYVPSGTDTPVALTINGNSAQTDNNSILFSH